jgi:hypothetical protein
MGDHGTRRRVFMRRHEFALGKVYAHLQIGDNRYQFPHFLMHSLSPCIFIVSIMLSALYWEELELRTPSNGIINGASQTTH